MMLMMKAATRAVVVHLFAKCVYVCVESHPLALLRLFVLQSEDWCESRERALSPSVSIMYVLGSLRWPPLFSSTSLIEGPGH